MAPEGVDDWRFLTTSVALNPDTNDGLDAGAVAAIMLGTPHQIAAPALHPDCPRRAGHIGSANTLRPICPIGRWPVVPWSCPTRPGRAVR